MIAMSVSTSHVTDDGVKDILYGTGKKHNVKIYKGVKIAIHAHV